MVREGGEMVHDKKYDGCRSHIKKMLSLNSIECKTVGKLVVFPTSAMNEVLSLLNVIIATSVHFFGHFAFGKENEKAVRRTDIN